MPNKVYKEVRNAKEYKEAVDAAKTLGLTLKKVNFYGSWESDNGEPVFMSSGRTDVDDIREVGRKYFHVEIATDRGDEVVPIQPAHSSIRDTGKMGLEFR